MEFPGFIGPSYLLDSVKIDCQRSINLYFQPAEQGGRPALIRTPGIEELTTLGTGENRGMFTADSVGRSFAIVGNKVYETTGFVYTQIGTLLTNSGQCGIDENGVQLLIVDGLKGYVYTFATNTWLEITDPDFPRANHCCFIDQYLIVNEVGSRRFYLSALSDATDWDGLDFASKEGAPDELLSIQADHRELFLIGKTSSEVWADTGAADFPFERVPGAFIEFGTCAPYSVKKLDNRVFLLSQDKNGQGLVTGINGYQGQRVSTYAIERAIETATDLSSATAWTYQQDGHSFYCLNIPGLTSTLVLDVSTGFWHERDSWTTNGFTRSRAQNHCMVSGVHMVGDYQSGQLGKLSKTTYTEYGNPLRARRTFPHAKKELKRLFVSEMRLDMENGVTNAAVCPDPQIFLRVSRDGGHTWSSEKWRSIGKVGQYKNRVMWNKLGSSRDFVFDVQCSDPVPVNLLAAYLDAAVGLH